MNLKKLKDITGLSKAPHLEDLIVGGTPNLYPARFSQFCRTSDLEARLDKSRSREDVKVKELVGLKSAGARSTFVFSEP